ncbi:MAG TPA: hypothetical protein VGB95_04650 [Chitinophagales bacterium]
MKFIDNPLTRFIFFGNYFYGICTVALSMEAQLQQGVPFTSGIYYAVVFSLTIVYYSIAYITDKTIPTSTNERTKWYAENHTKIRWSQRFFSVVAIIGIVGFFIQHFEKILSIPLFDWLLLFSFPLAAVFYYGIKGVYTLRNIGFLKPFVIAWVWTGVVTFYPMIVSRIEHNLPFDLELINFTLLFKNFLFISVLCILFDLKDYETDANHELKTFVVNLGLHRTIAYIVFPLCLLGFGAFLTFGFTRHFSAGKILLNTVPFLLTMLVSYSMYNKKNIFYYLIVIDGMMLVKAVCGSVAMIYF